MSKELRSHTIGISAVIACAVAVCGMASTAGAQCTNLSLSINGSFEFPTIPNNSFQQVAMPPWERFDGSATASNIFVFRGTVGSIWPTAHTGVQFADVGNTESLKCDFVMPYAALTTISWHENTASGAAWSAYNVYATNFADPFGSFGFGLASQLLNAANGGVWQEETLFGALGPGLHELSFNANGVASGFDTLIDSVTITLHPQPFAFQNSLAPAVFEVYLGRQRTVPAIYYRMGGQNIALRWEIEGPDSVWTTLNDGAIPGFGSVSGASTPTPSFSADVRGASIRVRPFVSNACGGADGLPLRIEVPLCDSIDFNNDGLFPDDNDLVDFLAVLAGGACSNDPNCNDIDFNNDGLFPDDNDLVTFLTVLAGGSC
jgi:hypothetical protein